VLLRSGHTEAATDPTTLAGLPAVGLLGELVNDDGSVKRLPELFAFAREHKPKLISIADLIAYRRSRERLVERIEEFEIDTEIGPARAITYATPFDSVQHLALIFGKIADAEAPSGPHPPAGNRQRCIRPAQKRRDADLAGPGTNKQA